MKNALMRAICAALDGLEVGFCAFDNEDRTLAWNNSFLDLFPEHKGHVHQGEHYRDNLQRFYTGRLGPDELPRIDSYIAEGLERHRTQRRPYEFEHRGYRVRVSSVEIGPFGRLRVWRKVAEVAAQHPPQRAQSFSYEGGANVVLERMTDGVLVVDPGDRMLWANPAFLSLYGLDSVTEARGSSFERIYRAAWAGETYDRRFQKSLATLTENQRFSGAPYELALPGNRWVRVVEQRGDALDGRGCFVHVDITTMKRQQHALREAEAQARESEARYRLLAEYSSDVTVALSDRKFVYVSPAITKLLGWAPDALVGKDILDFCHPDDVCSVVAAMRRLTASPEADYRARALHANGGYVWMEARASLSPQPVNAPSAPMLVINARSIAARKNIEDDLENVRRKLEELAISDGLTSLANRRKFDESLDMECRRAQRDGSSTCLLLLDLDNFKSLNDTCGHPAGDEVLRTVAAVLGSFAQRAGDLAARIGGEEFALLLPNTDLEQAEAIAEKLRAAVALLEPPVNYPGLLSISVGVCSTDHSRLHGSPVQLLSLADEALYAAKRGGKNQVQVLRDQGSRGLASLVSGNSRLHH